METFSDSKFSEQNRLPPMFTSFTISGSSLLYSHRLVVNSFTVNIVPVVDSMEQDERCIHEPLFHFLITSRLQVIVGGPPNLMHSHIHCAVIKANA